MRGWGGVKGMGGDGEVKWGVNLNAIHHQNYIFSYSFPSNENMSIFVLLMNYVTF